MWKIEFPNIESYDNIQKQCRSYLSKEQKEADEALINELVRNVSREKLVLDVASGMGRLLLVLSHSLRKKAIVLGTDVDEKPLRGAKLKLTEQKTYDKVSLCVMDGKHLALKSQKLSCIPSFFGFDNIPNNKDAFQEVHRVLIPDGRLALATLWLKENSKSLALAEEHGYGAIETKDRLIGTLEETGFQLDSTETFYSGKWPHNPMDLIPVEGDHFAHVLVLAHKT